MNIFARIAKITIVVTVLSYAGCLMYDYAKTPVFESGRIVEIHSGFLKGKRGTVIDRVGPSMYNVNVDGLEFKVNSVDMK